MNEPLQIYAYEFRAIRTKKGMYKTFENVVTGEVRCFSDAMVQFEIEQIIINDWKSKYVSHEVLSKTPTGVFL